MTPRATAAPRDVASTADRGPNRLWRMAFGIALLVQLIVVYTPEGPAGLGVPGLDKLVHVTIFAAPAVAALMVGISPRWALGILALHAPVSELIQHFALPHRSGDAFDAIADLVGVGLGAMLFVVWSRRQH